MALNVSGFEEWVCEDGNVLLIPHREAEKRRTERRIRELRK